MYKLTGVSKIYRKGRRTVPAVRDLDLVIEDGQWLAVQGRTGHGKTTLLRALGMRQKIAFPAPVSRTALATILKLPAGVRPELIICLGHPATRQPPGMRRQGEPRWDDLTQWERGC